MFLLHVLQWSELWSTLLPIIVWTIKRPNDNLLKPVKVYLVIALCLYLWAFSAYFGIIETNVFIYTLLSICRLISFAWFFSFLNIYSNEKIIPAVLLLAIILIILNFLLLEDFQTAFSSNTFSLEGIILLIFCIQYFLKKLRSDNVSAGFDAAIYIVTGLAIYEAICFPVFLFYSTLTSNNELFAAHVWNIVQNITYIVFCLFIARAFYGTSRHPNY